MGIKWVSVCSGEFFPENRRGTPYTRDINAAGVRKDSRALTADEHAFVEERLARGLRFAAIAPMLGMSEPDLQRAYGVVVQEMPEVVSRADREAARAKRRASRYAESRQERALTTWQAKKPANIAREGER